VDEKRLFGELAIQKGFVTIAQVKQALEVQREMRKCGEGHKLIGVLLVELGYMTPVQVMEVLDTYDAEREAEMRARPRTDEPGAASDAIFSPEDTSGPLPRLS
jgi:hypothetical protein